MKLIIFDWKRTLYDPDARELYDGAQEIMKQLHSKRIRMMLIGKDQGGDMNAELDKLAARRYFERVLFTNQNKTPELFREFTQDVDLKDVWVVGDRVRSEIKVGNSIGANTVWLKSGKFAHEAPLDVIEIPDYTVSSLRELRLLLFT